MKPAITYRLLVLLLLSISAGNIRAQNMVPNGDFEYYTSCPTNSGQVIRCTGWRPYTLSDPDYDNACNTGTTASVPTNYAGYQFAASGNAYATMVDYYGTSLYREYIARTITALSAGARYEVSMSVSLSDNVGYGSNGLGIYFYNIGPTSVNTLSILPVTAQVLFASQGPITNQTGWTRLIQTFTSDSAYDNIVIGGFLDNSQISISPSASGGSNQAYYYVDSVVIRLTSYIRILYTGKNLCAGDTFNVPYSLFSSTVFASNNVFTVQLSNSNGLFNSGTSIIGSNTSTTSGNINCTIPSTVAPSNNYRIRILSSNIADTSGINFYPMTIGIYPASVTSSALISTICSRDSIQLYGSSTTSNVAYLWSGPSSYTSASQNPVIYNAATSASGKYLLTVSNYGCKTKDSVTITVNPSPNTITASYNTPLCEADTLKLLSTNSSSGVTWGWAGSGSYTASVQNPIRPASLPAMSGKYYVTATAANGCKAKDSVDVTVKPLPANFSATSNTPICENNTVNLYGSTTSSSVTWAWSGPSFSSTLQNPAISSAQPSASGDYILTATLNGCVIKDTVNVIVNPIPAAPTLSANTPVCTGQDLQLTGNSISGASFSWSGPGGFTSSLQNPVRTNATTAMAGQYTAHVTVAACVSADAAVNVTVVPAPNILMYLSPNDSICQGSTVNFSTNVTNAGTGATYKWFKNNSPITGATNSTYSTNTAADYDSFFCTITSNGTCASAYTDSSTSITMRVFPWLAPAVSINANPTTPIKKGDLINFTATPVNGGNTPRYQWKRNNKDVVGAISNVWGAYTLDDRDTICVVLTSSYLCPQPPTAKSNCIIVSVNTTSITGVNWQNNPPNVYPNPTREKLIIEGVTKGTTIQLMDVLGRILISQTATNETELLNTSQLAQGNYLLQLRDKDNNTMTVKITRD